MGSGLGPMAAPRPMGPPQTGLSGADVLRILRARLVLIIILALLFFAIGTGVTLIFYFWYPSYSATSYIRVQSINPINVMNPLERQPILAEEVLRLLQDQALMVKSPGVLQSALEDNDLRNTDWYREAERKLKEKNEEPADLLADILTASPVRESNFVGVSATWRVAKEVPIIVNTVVQKYLFLINKLQRDTLRSQADSSDKELEATRNDYETKQREIDNYRTNEEVQLRPGEEGNETIATLKAIETELGLDTDGKKAQFDALQDIKPEELPITPELQNQLNGDPVIYQLDQRVQEADELLRALQGRYGPNHRRVKEAQSSLEIASERAAGERAQKAVKYNTDLIEQTRRNYLEALEQLTKVKDRRILAEQEQRDKDAKHWKYKKLLEESEQMKAAYERQLDLNNQMKQTMRLKDTVQIDVRSSAVAPKRKSQPKLEIWLPAAGILGIGLAIGIALLLELSDTTVRTPRDVLRQSMPVLGTVPITDDDEVEIDRVETACLDAPHSITAEAFRNLRTNLFFSAPAEQQATLLVTSPHGGNGKTTIACNLAISVALSGRRVLLVDTNFRRSCLPKIFPGMPQEGLSNVLIGQGRLENYVTSTSVPGLDVLGAGPIPPNPAELLGSSYLRDLIGDARTRYDQVIFDGPPLLLVSDAMVLASLVDGVIMVCQYRVTSRGALQRSASQLASVGARIFGAVLNRVETRAGGYFRKSYREFYEYQEQEADDQGVTRQRLDGGAAAAGAAVDAMAEGAAGVSEIPGGPSLLSEMSPTAVADPDALDGSWGSSDLDSELNKISGEQSLGDIDEFKIADDLKLDDDLGKKD
jgi:polysaccharide biosynthesis transport protein